MPKYPVEMCKGIRDLFLVLYRNHLPHLPPFWGFRTLRGQIPWHLLCFRDYAYQGRFWLSDICWCLVFFFFRTPIASGITGSVLLIIFRSLISLCFITCLIRISFNLKKDQKNRPHDPTRFIYRLYAVCSGIR